MSDLPELGASTPTSPIVPVAVLAIAVGALAGGGYWWTHREPATDSSAPVAQGAAPEAPAVAEVLPTPAEAPTTTPLPGSAATKATVAASPPSKSGLQTLHATITGPLESAIVEQVGREVGGPLTQVINRSLVWWLKVPGELLKGDTVTALYEAREGQEPLVHAVRYTSRKFGKTFEAFRYQPKGDPHARFFQPDGSALEERLVDSPLDRYEQITSLLRDGRKHKGVDFKAPVGTPVRATFEGTIARKNWNFRGNGNSVEVQEFGGQGRTALFLHLSDVEKGVSVGVHVNKGQVIARSGNTGRSFAPHLHYQLMHGTTVVDPFKSHRTERAQLPADERAAFEAVVASHKSQLPKDTLAGN